MNRWDVRFLELAKHVASWSKDPRTKVGAVLVNDTNQVLSLGFLVVFAIWKNAIWTDQQNLFL
jgi:deoxycytidylate deaminase